MEDTAAMLVVARALVQSYPTWTDEHGTNVEQLAAIAVAALSEHGLLAEPHVNVDIDLNVDLTEAPLSSGITRDRT